jgi:CRISPR-associated protein Cas2
LSTYVVVAYDIDDHGRRRRLARLLEGFGERVQRSVFECDLNGRELAMLLHRLERFAHAGDAIRVYRLPPHVAAGTRIFGGLPLVRTPNITIV